MKFHLRARQTQIMVASIKTGTFITHSWVLQEFMAAGSFLPAAAS